MTGRWVHTGYRDGRMVIRWVAAAALTYWE